MEKLFYLDNAATTKMFAEELEIIKEANENFYNPSAGYKKAFDVHKKLESARENISLILGGRTGKLYFTSSATESNNTVFCGVHLKSGNIVLISAGEHPSVYNSAHNLEKKGIIVKDIPLLGDGKVDTEKFKQLLADDTKNIKLVSVMHVSNETGAVNDIKELCRLTKYASNEILFHSDGVQALGKLKINLTDLGVDFYTISAHKIYAPRGIAGLWIKNGTVVSPLLLGGGQEGGFRSSTENVAGALAFEYAVKKVYEDLNLNCNKLYDFKLKLLNLIQNSKINAFLSINSNDECVPSIISISFAGIKGEVLMHALEDDGVLMSTGSACSSKHSGNRTLNAMGINEKAIVGSVRISPSAYEEYDIDYIAEKIINNVLKFELIANKGKN